MGKLGFVGNRWVNWTFNTPIQDLISGPERSTKWFPPCWQQGNFPSTLASTGECTFSHWVHFSFRDMLDSLKVSKPLKMGRKFPSSNQWFSGATLVLGIFRWKNVPKRLHVHRTRRRGHPFLVETSLDSRCTSALMPKPPGSDGWQVSARFQRRMTERYNDTSKNRPTDTNDHFQQLYPGQLMNAEMGICNVYM